MSKKNQIIPVDRQELVEVYMALEVSDCYHMDELFMAVASTLSMMQNKKVKLIHSEIEIIDPKTGELKYNDQPLMTCSPSLRGTEDVVYGLNEVGQIFNEHNTVIYDAKEDLK
jgi:hypothetical protein